MAQKYFILVALTLLIMGCSPKEPNSKPQGVLTDGQKQTLEKAKQTEAIIKKATEENLKQVDSTNDGQ